MTLPADIAEQLQAAGFLVLAGGEVEAAGAALLLGITPKTLRNWRSELAGPPWRVARGLAWYRIADVLAWRGTSASLHAHVVGAKLRSHLVTTRDR